MELPLLERTTRHAVESSGSGDGTFSAILASEGEASDGHILSMRGLEVFPSMPMLFGHSSTEQIPLVGTVRKPRKATDDGVRVLRVEGKINMNGDGVLSDVRRGLAQLVEDGDLQAMSLRASTKAAEPRRNLSKDHPAYIDTSKMDRDDPRRYGFFISRSSALEGSLVAIGADPKALIGRADATQVDAVRTFWRAMAESGENSEDGMSDLGEGFTVLREAIEDLHELGVDDHELAEVLAGEPMRESVEYAYEDESGESRVCRIPRQAYDALVGESLDAYRGALSLHADHAEAQRRLQAEERRIQAEASKQRGADHTALVEAVTRSSAQVGEAVDNMVYRLTGRLKR